MDGAEERTPTDGASLQGDDFLSCLTDEEKECLQYLLETIDSLDQGEEENANNEHDPGDHLTSSSSSLPDRTTNLKSRSGSVKVSEKADLGHAPSKMKIVKSYSEDSPGLSITVTPDMGQRSSGSHPSHLRKFDTIMRSGVNVQELRARFVRQPANSFLESSLTSKQAGPAARSHASPRTEALQKLGLLNLNQSNPNTGQSSPREQHDTDEHRPPGKSFDLNQNHPKPALNLPRSAERKPGGFDKIWPP